MRPFSLQAMHPKILKAVAAISSVAILGCIAFVIFCFVDVNAFDGLALTYASSKGSVPLVKAVLSRHPDLHIGDDRALLIAAMDGHNEVVNLLLADGANVHAKRDTALYLAVTHNHPDVVQSLLNSGAKVSGCEGAVVHREARLSGSSEMLGIIERAQDGLSLACPVIELR